MSNPTLMAFIPNWNWNELQKVRLQNLASDPVSPTPQKGWVYFNTTANEARVYNGTTWVAMAGSGGSTSPLTTKGDIWMYSSADGRFPVSGNNGRVLVEDSSQSFGVRWATNDHTLISDFDTQVRTSRLDQMAAPTADVSMGSHKLTNVTDPTSAQDAATKNYVDLIAQGLDFKASVRVVVTTNGTLASAYENGDSAGGVTLATGDRILLAGQTTASENGIVTVNATGAPTRASDADASGEISKGTVVYVEAGTNQGQLWICTATGATPWVPNSSTSTWTQFAGAADIVGGAGLTKTGNTLDVGQNADNSILVGTNDIQANPAVVEKGTSVTFGDNSASTFTLTHNLNTKKVHTTFRDASTDEVFHAFWKANNVNSIDVDMNGYVLGTDGAVAHISATQ